MDKELLELLKEIGNQDVIDIYEGGGELTEDLLSSLSKENRNKIAEIVGRNAERTAAGEKVDNFKGNVSNSLQLANTINSIRNASKQKREGRDLYNEGKNFTPTVTVIKG